MEIEDRIRTQIEAILVNDAKNFTEIRQNAVVDEPLDTEELQDERNLYHRIISGYRNAVSEVNKLLEENIGSLSAFYRIVESIKEKENFEEICSQIIDSVLRDFGAEYASLLFPERTDARCLEGIREERQFLRIHSKVSLLGSREFEEQLMRIAEETLDCLNIEDIYKEPRFNSVDFPAVVRSVLCLPLILRSAPVGFLILSHSLPKFFHDNHVRVLKILGSLVAHLCLLHRDERVSVLPPAGRWAAALSEKADSHAIVLLEFESLDSCGRRVPAAKQVFREMRQQIQKTLSPGESVLFYEDRMLMVFLPGIRGEALSARVCSLRECFEACRSQKAESLRDVTLNTGFSVCEGEEGLSRTLEVASLVMRPEAD